MMRTFPDFRELCPELLILQCCKASFAISEMNFWAANDISRILKQRKIIIHTDSEQDTKPQWLYGYVHAPAGVKKAD